VAHPRVFKAIFWHSGEADGSNGNYAGDLARVIENLRNDLDITNLPFAWARPAPPARA